MTQTAANATHLLECSHHLGSNVREYTMPCHILGTTPKGRLKLLVFGELYWKGREHVSKVRYVEAARVRLKPVDAAAK
jgi:hypothetical protein